MADIMVMIIILTIVGAATAKIVVEKRKGAKCIGCPYSQSCSSDCSSDHIS